MFYSQTRFLKTLTLATFFLLAQMGFGQTPDPTEIPRDDFERPFNFFAAAGASFRFQNLYDVTISSVDYTVQFEDVSPIHTRFSAGLVWTPFLDNKQKSVDKYFSKINTMKDLNQNYTEVKAERSPFAIALLINVAQLSFSSDEINTTSPIDVGFGFGYRKDKFLILATVEFTPMRAPREYFIEDYRNRDLSLVLSGGDEPVRTISVDDNSLFTSKIFVTAGLKIAYSFTKS